MTKSEIYAKIQRSYDRERNSSELKCEGRKKELYAKIPRLAEIQQELGNTGTSLAEIFINGGNRAEGLLAYRVKCESLEAEKKKILLENGYPENYLEVEHKCKRCKDTGYIGDKRCGCFKRKLTEFYYNMSNIEDVIKKENFDNFNINLYSDDILDDNGVSAKDNIKKILADVMDKLSKINVKPANLLFSGSSGMGKTYMSNCIAKYLMDRGMSVVYMSAFNLLDAMIKERFSFESNDDKIKIVEDCDLLIIDDLGTEGINNNTLTALFNILNTRLLTGKSTIISTNFTVQEIYKIYSERIVSRIMGNYKVYKFFGNDLRIL
ncbi:MAG: ATP-binding protein [Lachnospirales bacterium]